MSITFLVTVQDDGSCTIDKLSDPVNPMPGVTPASVLRDPSFETGVINDGDRIDLHVKISEQVKRDVIITLLDDSVPIFSSPEEAEQWMAARQSGPGARYG